MTDYKTLRVPADAYEAAREAKRETETWGEFLQRCSETRPEIREFVEATDADADTDGETGTDRGPVTLEAAEYGKIADELETRLR